MSMFPGVSGPSDGERGLVLASAAIAVIGALTSHLVLHHLNVVPASAALRAWTVVAGGIALPLAVWLLRGQIGHAGWDGAIRATIAFWAAVPLVGLIGGTLLLPLHGTMFGPLGLVATLIAHPPLAALWVASFAGTHLMAMAWRDERDSIFRVTLPRV